MSRSPGLAWISSTSPAAIPGPCSGSTCAAPAGSPSSHNDDPPRAGALLFLVIGIILQAWQARRPFAARRPALLAFPIAWALIVPETLLRGGSLLAGAVVATAVALAFAVQWGALFLLREAMS